MRILWLSQLPNSIARESTQETLDIRLRHDVSWVAAHLPPPDSVDLHIACLWPGATQQRTFSKGGATWHLIPTPSRGRALTLFQFDTLLYRPVYERVQPDVVHGWGTEDSCGLAARRLAPDKHLIGIQGLIYAYRRAVRMKPLYRYLLTEFTERITLRTARWIVAESYYSLETARLLAPNAELMVAEHPVRSAFLEGPITSPSSRRVVFVGELAERKGISQALNAFAAATTASSEWVLDIIGTGSPQMQQQIEHTLTETGISGRVRLHGHLTATEVARVMRSGSIYLLPTKIDTGPTSLKEALCQGLWPICYDNSGPGEYIRRFDYGTLAADRDVVDLSQKLRDAMRAAPWQDLRRRDQLVTAAREFFSRARAWSALANVYDRIAQ
jgi:glycosyltransferase involved in cell wall biosynthesis